jgi:uncharacterized delta-60 repeat protein
MKGNKSSAVNVPRIRIIAPTAALATGLAAPIASGGPGDLDPAFGDVGRVSGLPALSGQAWSLDATDEDILFGGADDYCSYYYYCDYTGFTARMGPDGVLDATYAAARLQDTTVRDVVVQADGKPVAVGTRYVGWHALVVFRLNTDGSLDSSFGTEGVVTVAGSPGTDLSGTSLVLGAEGRIIVAGTQGGRLLVMRLLPDGAPDASFGSDGSFVWDAATLIDMIPKIVRLGTGGYRVMVNVAREVPGGYPVSDCRVLALTESGAPDAGFGTGGLSSEVVAVPPSGNHCSSIGLQQDGRAIVAGSTYGDPMRGFAARLLSTGGADTLFAAAAVPASMREVTALAVAANDSIALGGHDRSGLSGALVVRLQADGHLDALFGRDGQALFDIDAEIEVWPVVHDMQVLADGAILVSGGMGTPWSQQPFVAKLRGDTTDGPGIVDLQDGNWEVHEADQTVDVAVRRIGGRSGAITVAYRAEAVGFGHIATPGADFTAVEGQLTWADGDDSTRYVTVPVAQDAGPAERPERFQVSLGSPEGGAGTGTRTSGVTIVGDGYPAGLFSLEAIDAVREGQSARVRVSRNDYGDGAVSVNVTVAGGSATEGLDYSLPGQTVQLAWGDRDFALKEFLIPLTDDGRDESRETITLALTGPTGGAVIGPQSTAEVAIRDNDDGGGGGGGRIGALFAWLAGLAVWRRARKRAAT